MSYQSLNLRGNLEITFTSGMTEHYPDIKSISVDGNFLVAHTNTGDVLFFSYVNVLVATLK